jgi:hypothetical protein
MNRNVRPKKKLRRRRMKESAWSWFQLAAGKAARHTLVQRVQNGDVHYARRLTLSRTAVVLDYAGQEIAFIYSSASKEIISFLPLDAAELAGWREGKG